MEKQIETWYNLDIKNGARCTCSVFQYQQIKNGKIVRLHIPIITSEQVTMITWLETKTPTKFKMKKGECWWLDVSKSHQVLNESEIDRIHLVIDVYVNNFMTEALQ